CGPGRLTSRRRRRAGLYHLQRRPAGAEQATNRPPPRPGEAMSGPLQIHTIVSMPFQENTYVVGRPDRADALVIDPGLEPGAILEFLREGGRSVAAILNTHGHLDHIGGNEALKAAFPEAPLLIGAGDAVMLTDPEANFSAPILGVPIVSPPA